MIIKIFIYYGISIKKMDNLNNNELIDNNLNEIINNSLIINLERREEIRQLNTQKIKIILKQEESLENLFQTQDYSSNLSYVQQFLEHSINKRIKFENLTGPQLLYNGGILHFVPKNPECPLNFEISPSITGSFLINNHQISHSDMENIGQVHDDIHSALIFNTEFLNAFGTMIEETSPDLGQYIFGVRVAVNSYNFARFMSSYNSPILPSNFFFINRINSFTCLLDFKCLVKFLNIEKNANYANSILYKYTFKNEKDIFNKNKEYTLNKLYEIYSMHNSDKSKRIVLLIRYFHNINFDKNLINIILDFSHFSHKKEYLNAAFLYLKKNYINSSKK